MASLEAANTLGGLRMDDGFGFGYLPFSFLVEVKKPMVIVVMMLAATVHEMGYGRGGEAFISEQIWRRVYV